MSETPASVPPAGTPASSPEASSSGCGPRRGRRFVIGSLGLVLAAFAGAAALRASGHVPSRPFSHGAFGAHCLCDGASDKHVSRAVGWVVDDIGGTPEQQEKLTAIARAAVSDLCVLKAQAKENHLQAAAALTKETVDRPALEAIRVKQMELANAASTRLTKAIADSADVLTPAQRVELAARLQKLHG